MQISVQSGDGLERRVRIELPPEEVAREVEKRLQKLGRSARLPGFRPGKVPMKVLRQRFGDAVHHEVFGEMVDASFSEALARESLRPAGAPRIEPEVDVDERRFGFTATFEVLPQLELASLQGRVIKSPKATITEDDLQAVIERLRRQRATWKPVERPGALGDRLTISFEGTVEGESFEGGAGSGVEIELGAAGMIPGFEDGLVGASAGEQRALDLVFPKDYRVEQLAGRAVRFDVAVEAVAEVELPPVDADLARSFGVEDGDVARFREDVRKNMERELSQRLAARRKDAVMELLLETHPVELPQVLVQQEIRSMSDQMRASLRSKDLRLPEGLFDEAARRRVSLGLIIGEIVRQQGIRADAQRVRAAVEEMASTYEHPQAVIDYYYADPKRLSGFEGLVLETQVVDWVLGQVTVEDEVLSFAEATEPASAA